MYIVTMRFSGGWYCYHLIVSTDDVYILTEDDEDELKLWDKFCESGQPRSMMSLEDKIDADLEFDEVEWTYKGEVIFEVVDDYSEDDYDAGRMDINIILPYGRFYVCYIINAGVFLLDRKTFKFVGSIGFKSEDFNVVGRNGGYDMAKLLLASKDFNRLVDVLREVSQ